MRKEKNRFSRRVYNTLILFVLITNAVLIWWILFEDEGGAECETMMKYNNERFNLISPDIAWMDVDTFLKQQESFTISYRKMREEIEGFLEGANGTYGIYFEDLNTGSWIGLNEKEKFIPASLNKLPLLIATLRKVEEGNLWLYQPIIITENDLDIDSVIYYGIKPGMKMTLKDALILLVKKSDNTAMNILLSRMVSIKEYDTAALAIGMPSMTSLGIDGVSAKEYSNALRALYSSTYLRRQFSQLGLSLMINTEFDNMIPRGVPKDVKVAHKVGFNEIISSFSDCGIIYHPTNPYLLCIMSKNIQKQEAENNIKEISNIVFKYVDGHN